MFKTLDEIAIKHGTDKSSKHHNYCEKYEKMIGHLRLENNNILELGFGGDEHDTRGGAGLATWAEYFEYSKVTSIDIHSKVYVNTDRTRFMQGSQTDEAFLNRLSMYNTCWDIIIDDASHNSLYTIKSLQILWPALKPGGWYIIEDLETSYWDNEQFMGGLNNPLSTVNCLKDMIDSINHEHSGIPDQGVYAMNFFEKICFIQKKL